jgi:hypothetical protein
MSGLSGLSNQARERSRFFAPAACPFAGVLPFVDVMGSPPNRTESAD